MSLIPPLTERLDRLLPQTQCGQCGYDGCRPYAQAMARGEAGVDRCPPGGDAGARALAQVLGVPAIPFDRSRGEHKAPQVAVIVEADCIGCTKCIQACPVDAIVGGAKYMHTVIADLCTGCELCIPPCPVDCIELVPMPLEHVNDPAHADAARNHFRRREARLQRQQAERAAELAARKAAVESGTASNPVLAALARARARQQAKSP
jgi:electron transport complex protein RnfB